MNNEQVVELTPSTSTLCNDCLLCVEAGCAEPLLEPSGALQAERQEEGAVYRFSCSPESGSRLVGSRTVVCDGRRYNDSTPVCVRGPTRLSISGPDWVSPDQEVTFTCSSDEVSQPGRLHWSLTDNTGRQLKNVIVSTESSEVTGEVGLISMSSLTISLSEVEDGVVIACVSESEDHTVTEDKRLDVHCEY